MMSVIPDKRTMKAMNEPMQQRLEHRLVKTKKKKRKPKVQRLTYRQLERTRTPIFIKTFDRDKYMYVCDQLHTKGIPSAVNLNTLKSVPLKDLYYNIRHVRVADTTSEKQQIIARRKQADAELLFLKGMQQWVIVPTP
ncbi:MULTISPECIES: hypothetical protein [Listeria]|uniref:hypothetical protein n=1 Tax=Listeria TaxID=1637 RepID=UPI000B592FE4|nr:MULTISPECIES: hypothetical protein [Listeria]